MNTSTISICVMTGLFLSVTAFAQDHEKRLKKSDLPAEVQKTADEYSKGATVRGYSKEIENGKPEYEVELTVDGHSKDVNIDETGAVIEIEEQVQLDKLSAPARDGLKNKAGDGKITKVESITKHGKVVAYEAQVLTGSKKTEVQVAPDGKPLDHEE
jgi:uncharacterized membrane protein YkoI